MSATSGGGGSVSEGSEAGGSSQSTMSVGDSPSTSFQANLGPENVTKITLSEENIAGNFSADMTGSKINLSLDERQQKDGIVNVAFEYEEGANRGSGGGAGEMSAVGAGTGGGDFRSINGSDKKDKVPEAVNLELVNMVPYSNGNGTSYGVPVNGIPMKKDSEQVDMSTPYDEYFVPVNEHKKYMRGEKLYVTKDKRRPTSWRRCLSWIVACTVISVVLILAILAGTGVILSQEPNLVKEASVGRNFAGSNLKPSVTNKSPAPTAEMYMYVPRSIESEFVIDNVDFDPALKDMNSTAYQQFATSMEDQLKMLLFDKETLEFGASDVGLKIVNISQDPFKVNYRIGWNYKQGVNNPPEPIKMEDVKKRLVESLTRNQGYIDKYHIDREAIKVNHVINTCQIDNGGCSHICYYNYHNQQFVCTCPTHLVIDNSGKNCIAWTGSSEDDALPVPSHTAGMPYGSTANPVDEEEIGARYEPGLHHHHGTQHDHSFGGQEHREHELTAEPAPEPTAEPNPDLKEGSAEYDKHKIHSVQDNDKGAAPEPTAEPDAKNKYDHDHSDHDHTYFHPAEHDYSDHEMHSVYKMTELATALGPELIPETTIEPESTAEPIPYEKEQDDHFMHEYKENEPSVEPTPEPAPEPTGDQKSEGRGHDHEGHSYGFKDHEPVAEPTPEPAAEPTAELSSTDKDHSHDSKVEEHAGEPVAKPTAEPNTEDKSHDYSGHSVNMFKDHELESSVKATPEPTPEPIATEDSKDSEHHDHTHNLVHGLNDHESAPEPTPEPASEPTSTEDSKDVKDHDKAVNNHEPAAEPTPEPEATGDSDEKHHDHPSHSSGFKDHEPAAEPTPEPTATEEFHEKDNVYSDHDREPSAEPTPELTATEEFHEKDNVYSDHDREPSAEPTPELTARGDSNQKDHEHSVSISKDHETAAEPTPEPTTDSDTSEKSYDSVVHTDHGSKNEEHIEPTAEPSPEGSDSTVGSSFETKNQSLGSDSKKASILHPVQGVDNPSGLKTEENQETEPTAEGDPKSTEPVGTTVHTTHQNVNSTQVVPSEEQTKETKTQHLTGVVPTSQSEAAKENKSTHQVPYLEEILIREAHPSSENGTGHSQNPLDNVELTENGKPVVEEIIIDKSREQTRFSSTVPSNISNESDSNIGATNSSTERPVFQMGLNGDIHQSEVGISTDHPKIMEYTVAQHSTPQSREADQSISGPTENTGSELATESNNQDSLSGHLNSSGDILGMKETDQAHETVSKMPVTTQQPEMQHEYHTISVGVQLPGGTKQESQTDMPAVGEEDSNTSGRPSIMEIDHVRDKPIDGETLQDRTNPHETTTEPQVAMTTLLTILTPEGVEKITDHLSKDKGSSGGEVENKTVNSSQSQQDGNETTKSQEEISDNIKDELSENEEFNTLIDEEYKNKDGIFGEGKETISKYPNKSLKTEKKKIKDYVKSEKTDQEKRGEVTARPGVTPEDFYLQKHVNGNENVYDLDFSLQNEHTTKHDGEVTVTDPHSIDGIPGVSFKPHGINNHDLSVLQTVAPDFRTETVFPTGAQELETLKPDSKNKENKDGDFKLEKDYPKFEKDYKYDKQKVSKKKDLKKKIGGKDGKNVELEDSRKYFTEISKEDLDISNEEIPEVTANPFEKTTVQPEIRTGLPSEVTAVPEHKAKADGTETATGAVEMRTEMQEHAAEVTELPGLKSTAEKGFKLSEQSTGNHDPNLSSISVDQKGHLTIEEPNIKSTSNVSPGTVYDGQLPGLTNYSNAGMTQAIINSTSDEHKTPGTVFDGIPHSANRENSTYVVFENSDSIPKIVSDGKSESTVVNSTTAHPTIIIHGQSGNLQDGHTMRFANSTFFNTSNATVVSMFNGTLTHPDGHSFSFTNYTATFPNGSAVHPTIVVRGQSGTLQDGHQIRFGNLTYQPFVMNRNSNVYRIENETLPGTVFDGHFNPQNGHYHMFTNSSGTFAYTNESTEPVFIIKGNSGDFGNSTAYIIRNNVTSSFNGGFIGPQSVVFRNSTVFAVETDGPETGEVQEITVQPHDVTNETIQFTNQMTPSFVSSGTAYKVNDYFGYISKCAAGQFQCVNGTSRRGSACISLSSKCDSIPDCSDGSDELGCIEKGCPGNFQCSDGTCLKRNLVCNGILDCSDESDEKNCESWKCEFDEFQCPSGRCIPVVWQCDGKPDCDNHTDEHNCQTSCGNDEYLCPEGWCIPLTYKCNGVKECSNGEDEQLCDCSHEEFKCQTGGCVSMKNVCDGLDDCPDRSDEWGCVKLEPETNLLKIRSATGEYSPVCADGWSSRYSDEVCASLGYFSSVPIENENGSSITTDSSFYVLKNDTTVDFNKKIIINLRKGDSTCSSGKSVEITCQEFSCGSRSMTDSSSVEARLVGGMSAASGQWPSVALLYNVRNFHSCTANVLTPRWVLASYNCLKMGNKNLNEQDWKFFGGSTVFETEKENAETRKILRIIPHPQLKFNQFLFTNDLALVELDQSLQFTSNLGAVCLPEQEIQPRQICVTAGWGMNSPEDKAIKQQLQYLPVPTMNLTECNSTEHYSGFITEDKICAGYNSVQKSLCYNEEGAPLMCVNDAGEWELQGVLSYHSNCGRGSHPSIFSSITPVADWIRKTIGNSFERKTLPATKR